MDCAFLLDGKRAKHALNRSMRYIEAEMTELSGSESEFETLNLMDTVRCTISDRKSDIVNIC